MSELTHGTIEELRFITNIGSLSADGTKYTRAYLLRGYLDGSAKRTHWGGMDRDKILAAARKELQKEDFISSLGK